MAERGEFIPIPTIIAGIRMAKFGEPLPAVPIDEVRNRLENIGVHAPNSHPLKTNPNVKDIRDLIREKLNDRTGSMDFH